MPKAERRYDRLAIRLSLIISRLLAGETLNVSKLAAEFGVSVRTLRRDFRERLMYLDLEYNSGNCRLLTGHNIVHPDQVALTFARQSGVAGMFPDLDSRLVNILLAGSDDAPCLIWHGVPNTATTSLSGSFYRLATAITEKQRVCLLADGNRCERLAPYRLILLTGCWYLTGEYQGRIAVFPLTDIHAVTFSKETYTRSEVIYRLTATPSFITALPHFRFIREVMSAFATVSAPVAEIICQENES
ncbi:DeoR family transcriptional regulator [Pectobacterium brasiliense]|uniref:helix-turn-helix transcriptional regulator n=1 Tax=Pectobacterium brasiliense TaxID=180957 RepID=UPI0015DEC93C|nr:DeoR family transcriptional regulator [Pectobacterium brasiliense]MBA0217814.1 DeoR family transcriptional regulator [Pectobacterium brasiliense]MBN3073854.1 DeoR family transcriptional regulator [Pectobacterium brasiliense]MBN3169277.1 DeoR family transcriptional regulator [Pectobacterium brasiliense]